MVRTLEKGNREDPGSGPVRKEEEEARVGIPRVTRSRSRLPKKRKVWVLKNYISAESTFG